LRATVELLAKGQTATAVEYLIERGKVKQIIAPEERAQAIAHSFVANPKNTLVLSADNCSRQKLNDAIRHELRAAGSLNNEEHTFRVLAPRQDMTGAERAWAHRYQINDVLRYSRGSKMASIIASSYATVINVNDAQNLLTVKKHDGELVTYDPRRLSGVSVYEAVERRFSVGDRIQFTAPMKQFEIANRELATIEDIKKDGMISARLEGNRMVRINTPDMLHFDHGYAVTSYSSQGLTADRVLIEIDSTAHPQLLNSRFAYVAVSRARFEVEIYTDDSAGLAERLTQDSNKSSAVDFSQLQNKSDCEGNLIRHSESLGVDLS
jgi:ATP-dependent exoDNAse (exonuclease V) alpha subunit